MECGSRVLVVDFDVVVVDVVEAAVWCLLQKNDIKIMEKKNPSPRRERERSRESAPIAKFKNKTQQTRQNFQSTKKIQLMRRNRNRRNIKTS